jgi:DNA-directed RNA polymerase specialized sigma subunit
VNGISSNLEHFKQKIAVDIIVANYSAGGLSDVKRIDSIVSRWNVLEKLQKTTYIKEQEGTRRQKQSTLEEYCDKITSLKQRDETIKKAVLDEYKQSEIAEFLKVSRTTISKSITKKENNG